MFAIPIEFMQNILDNVYLIRDILELYNIKLVYNNKCIWNY